jgi:hypothetical protein
VRPSQWGKPGFRSRTLRAMEEGVLFVVRRGAWVSSALGEGLAVLTGPVERRGGPVVSRWGRRPLQSGDSAPWRSITCSTALLAASNAALSRRWAAAVMSSPPAEVLALPLRAGQRGPAQENPENLAGLPAARPYHGGRAAQHEQAWSAPLPPVSLLVPARRRIWPVRDASARRLGWSAGARPGRPGKSTQNPVKPGAARAQVWSRCRNIWPRQADVQCAVCPRICDTKARVLPDLCTRRRQRAPLVSPLGAVTSHRGWGCTCEYPHHPSYVRPSWWQRFARGERDLDLGEKGRLFVCTYEVVDLAPPLLTCGSGEIFSPHEQPPR